MKQVLAGIDGCRGGWIAAIERPGEQPYLEVFRTFADIVEAMPNDAILAVDMPIGLPDFIANGGRGPEKIVRRFLGERQSSVFSIPSRLAVYANDYSEACRGALATSDPPRKVSRQAFALFPKIREIDTLLRSHTALCDRIIECHPEVAFWRLNGESAMILPKKIRGTVNPAGMTERRALLARSGFASELLNHSPPSGAAQDDCLDAMACLAIARRHATGIARAFPDPPLHDAYGIPVAIWA